MGVISSLENLMMRKLNFGRDRFGDLTEKSFKKIAQNLNDYPPKNGFENIILGEGYSLPCLYRNNSAEKGKKKGIETSQDKALEQVILKSNFLSEKASFQDVFSLSTANKKSAAALAWNVEHFCDQYGIERVGFLTLTFRDHVTSYREAQRRFNSMRKHVLKIRYNDYIRVIERQKSGRLHYHLLVALESDIRTGFDFKAIDNQDYRSANQAIRDEWTFWRITAPKYGFGRTELLPVKSNSEGIGKYVGKYIGKSIQNRLPEDKGCRLVEYSNGARMASTKFQFLTSGSAEWRRKMGVFVHYIAEHTGCQPTFEGMRQMLGNRWSYHWREFILNLS